MPPPPSPPFPPLTPGGSYEPILTLTLVIDAGDTAKGSLDAAALTSIANDLNDLIQSWAQPDGEWARATDISLDVQDVPTVRRRLSASTATKLVTATMRFGSLGAAHAAAHHLDTVSVAALSGTLGVRVAANRGTSLRVSALIAPPTPPPPRWPRLDVNESAALLAKPPTDPLQDATSLVVLAAFAVGALLLMLLIGGLVDFALGGTLRGCVTLGVLPPSKGRAALRRRPLRELVAVGGSRRAPVLRRGGGAIRVRRYCHGSLPESLCLCCHWDVTEGVSIDLDASAILLGADLEQISLVHFGQLASPDGSVTHAGDERKGSQSGDDETLVVSLSKVDASVTYIGFVISSYSGQELDAVKDAGCHLFEPASAHQIARFQVADSRALDKHRALLVGMLFREAADWWFEIIDEPTQGRTCADNVHELQAFIARRRATGPAHSKAAATAASAVSGSGLERELFTSANHVEGGDDGVSTRRGHRTAGAEQVDAATDDHLHFPGVEISYT